MSEIKHTPGPWHVGERRREFIDIKHSSNEKGAISGVLAQAIARETWASEGEANARLIAAAPELLEATRTALAALELIANEMTVGDRFTNAGQALLDALEPCRAAIAKAIGSQS